MGQGGGQLPPPPQSFFFTRYMALANTALDVQNLLDLSGGSRQRGYIACRARVLKPHPVNYTHARANAELRPRAYT